MEDRLKREGKHGTKFEFSLDDEFESFNNVGGKPILTHLEKTRPAVKTNKWTMRKNGEKDRITVDENKRYSNRLHNICDTSD